MAESEEELKSLLIRVKEESEKAGLKFSIQKTKIMASSPMISWQIDGEKWKPWQTSFSWAPKSLHMVPAAMKLKDTWVSLVAQTVKSLPAMQETQVLYLGQENPLEKGRASHSNILAWRIPWTEEPDGLHSIGLQRVRHSWVTNTAPWKDSYDSSRQHIKKQRHHFADKGPYSQSYCFFSSHVQIVS